MSCSLNHVALAERMNDPNSSSPVHVSTSVPVCFVFLIVIHVTEVLVLIIVILRQFLLFEILITDRRKDSKVGQDETALSCSSLTWKNKRYFN